jgi:hypothetical protein
MRDLDHLAAERLGHGVDFGRVAVAVAEEPHKPARTSLGEIALVDHQTNSCTLGLRG